jgi:hypothetical protein
MQLLNLTHVTYKRLLFTVNDYFLTKDVSLNADLNYCIQCPENVNNELGEFYTLLIDLKQPEESIWQAVYQRTQTEITSFTVNQDFEHRIVTDLAPEELKKFAGLYNGFARYKNIRPAELFRLKAYNKNGILAVSYIKQNGRFICINFYRLTQQRAVNLYSFHLKHQPDNIFTGSHYGRAHRALHWLDIKAFKQAGVERYDFCGWYPGTEDQELLNINKFKEQFTSLKIKEYSGVIYKNKFLKFLKHIKK